MHTAGVWVSCKCTGIGQREGNTPTTLLTPPFHAAAMARSRRQGQGAVIGAVEHRRAPGRCVPRLLCCQRSRGARLLGTACSSVGSPAKPYHPLVPPHPDVHKHLAQRSARGHLRRKHARVDDHRAGAQPHLGRHRCVAACSAVLPPGCRLVFTFMTAVASSGKHSNNSAVAAMHSYHATLN